MEVSVVSAPSVTSTTPATGSPASSSRARQRRAQLRLDAVEAHFLDRAKAAGGRGEPEDPHQELVGQRFLQRAVGPELGAQELRPRLAVLIGNRHAPRIVQEHGNDILLIDGGTNDERGTEEQKRTTAAPGPAAW